MRAYFALAVRSFQRAVSYRLAFWTELGVNVMFMFLYVCLWQALMEGRGTVGGYTESAVLTYMIVAQTILTWQFSVRTVWEVEARVRSGAIAFDLVRPLDFPTMMLAIALGPGLHTLLFNMLPKVGIFAVFGLVDGPPTVAAGAMFALSLTLGFLVQFGIEMLLGLAALWLVEVRGLHGLVVWGISGVCSGYFLPLELYPDWLAAISRALPFQSFIYTPAAIWVGRLAGGDAAQAIAVQVVWVVVLGLAGRAVFAAARRRLVVQGG